MPSITRHHDDVTIRPAGPIRGRVRLPGSKSLTNRHLMLAALADGASVLRGASLSDDVLAMIGGLRQLGVAIDIGAQEAMLSVRGCHGMLPADEADIDVRAAGTAMRFLTALCTLGRGKYRIDGSPRMRARPIGELVDALRQLGAGIGYERHEGFPPLTVMARGLSGGTVQFTNPPSSQFLSALLMAAPYAGDDVFIAIEGALPSRPYLDMTIAAMRARGVEALTLDGSRLIVAAPQRYTPGPATIEPDASAATYFWAAAAITGGSMCVDGLTRASLQGDVRFVDVLVQMGCEVEEAEASLTVHAPRDGRLRGIEVDLNDMPDTVQTLAVTAVFAEGPTRIRNVANLKLKETDRLAAVARELGKLGAEVRLSADGLEIIPPRAALPATIESYEDHRMAMSFALAGLAGAEVTVRNADCVAKSFPGFFEKLASV
ncbi:MAG: 3-phosphoshikimate 1-carboxyvinyltransferase [Planctomycetes bacterium]|nr:3-phosphoshikimate 1-carboxyvinyltransferase [Planctomycetota bacterium]